MGSWCWKFSDGFPETEQDLEFARREEGQGQGDRGAEKWDVGPGGWVEGPRGSWVICRPDHLPGHQSH